MHRECLLSGTKGNNINLDLCRKTSSTQIYYYVKQRRTSPLYLSLKKRLKPKATSFKEASITKVEVKK